jgi:hypothetical protein
MAGTAEGTSVHLDATPREVTLPFSRFLSIDRRAGSPCRSTA